jgi:hypothetical protein
MELFLLQETHSTSATSVLFSLITFSRPLTRLHLGENTIFIFLQRRCGCAVVAPINNRIVLFLRLIFPSNSFKDSVITPRVIQIFPLLFHKTERFSIFNPAAQFFAFWTKLDKKCLLTSKFHLSSGA